MSNATIETPKKFCTGCQHYTPAKAYKWGYSTSGCASPNNESLEDGSPSNGPAYLRNAENLCGASGKWFVPLIETPNK